MDKLDKYYLGKDGKKHILHQLKNGNSLSQHLLKKINLEEGQTFTYVPFGLSDYCVKQFERGGILDSKKMPRKFYVTPEGKKYIMVKSPNLDSFLVSWILKYVKNKNNYYCVFEEVLLNSNDEIGNIRSKRILTKGKELFYLLEQKDLNENALKETIKQVRTPWHFVAMLAEGDLSYLKNTAGQERVSESEMLKLCECVRVIIVGAYDGEGYVFWEVK